MEQNNDDVNANLDPSNPFKFCNKTLACGHGCKGVKGESQCLPCLKSECIQEAIDKYEAYQATLLKMPNLERQNSRPPRGSLRRPASLSKQQSADGPGIVEEQKGEEEEVPMRPCVLLNAAETELGGICFTSELGEEPCVRMTCGHVFHANCTLMMLTHRWTTLRITFGYLDCPACKQQIEFDYDIPGISDKHNQQVDKKKLIRFLSVQMAKEEGYDKEGRVVTPGDIYYGKLVDFAVHNCTFYECFRCKDPYFGGMEDCQQAMNSEGKLTKEDLFCKKCTILELGYGQDMCAKHGNEFVDWKCMFCCSVALFACAGGTGWYCTPCHNDAMSGRLNPKTQCTGGEGCPLGVPSHPEASKNHTKARYAIGCSLCRSEKLALISKNDNASAGVNLELRGSMLQRFGGVKGHDINRELQIVKDGNAMQKNHPQHKVNKQACCTIF